MKKIYYLLILAVFLSGCATGTVYLNTEKTPEQIEKDKADCEAMVSASDLDDPQLKQKKFDEYMQEKGYKVVSEKEAEKMQGFKQVWVNPGADFKAYEVIFIDKVDVSGANAKNMHIPDTKVTEEDITGLGDEMLKRFSNTLGVVMPVVEDKEKAAEKKALYVSLKLNDIAPANLGANAALEVAGHVSGIPFLPSSPAGSFSLECTVSDFSSQEKLMIISSETAADKTDSLIGLEKFERWQRAYNIMDYWADHLAALIAKARGEQYKPKQGFKVI